MTVSRQTGAKMAIVLKYGSADQSTVKGLKRIFMEPKFLSEISRKEWVLYEWLLIEEFGTNARWLKGRDRSPHEAIVAAEEWDFLQSIKDEAVKVVGSYTGRQKKQGEKLNF